MNLYLVVAVIIILSIVIYLQLRTETRKITIINSTGEKISIEVEIADTALKKAKGLMFRQELEQDKGMLFLFNTTDFHSFWMMNTKISLEAIHFSEEGKIVDIVQMDQCNTNKCKQYVPKVKSRYVLEVNHGFSKRNSVAINDSLVLDFE